MYSTVPSFISLNRIFPSPPSQVPHQTLEGLSHLFTHVNSTHPITSDSLETTDGRRSFFLLGEKWCLSAWTGAFNWCQPRPLETRTSSPEDTDGPLSTQISQTQLTPSALSSKSHCLEWHLLLGVQLYSLLSPTKFSPSAPLGGLLGTHFSLLIAEWGRFQLLILGLTSAPVTQDSSGSRDPQPWVTKAPMYKLTPFSSDSTHEGEKAQFDQEPTTHSESLLRWNRFLLTILFDTWLNYPGENETFIQYAWNFTLQGKNLTVKD